MAPKITAAEREAETTIEAGKRKLPEVEKPEQAGELWRWLKDREDKARHAGVRREVLAEIVRLRLRAKYLYGTSIGVAVRGSNQHSNGGVTLPAARGVTHSAAARKRAQRARQLAAIRPEVFELGLTDPMPSEPKIKALAGMDTPRPEPKPDEGRPATEPPTVEELNAAPSRLTAFVITCSQHGQQAAGLLIEAAVEREPESVDAWVSGLSTARDALDQLIERATTTAADVRGGRAAR